MEAARIQRIVWAIDAFEEETPLYEGTVRVLRYLSGQAGARVQPVFVLSPAQLNLSMEFSTPWLHQYQPAAEQALQAMVDRSQIQNIERPQVVTQGLSSTAQSVRTLIEYSRAKDADLIVVATHGRHGWGRILLGSFAETLLTHSSIPVLTVGMNAQAREPSFKRILFPTEFGRYSKEVFKRVVHIARGFGSSLVLFHAIPHPIEPVFQSGVYLLGGSWVPVQAYFAAESERLQRRADAWARWATRQGVPTEVLVETKQGSITDAILDAARDRGVGLIAMEGESGPVASALIGSITRQVIRHSPCPVWAFRSTKESRATLRRAAA